MKNRLHKLLSLFTFEKITSGQFHELRENVRGSSGKEMEDIFKRIWEDDRTPLPVPLTVNKKVAGNLYSYTKKRSYSLRWLKIASVILLPLLLTWGPYWLITENKQTAAEIVIMADVGQKSQIILPDGSKVWLNSESVLKYPADFGKKDRTVHLSGEGYFEVKHNDAKRFSVETDAINVVVHGTKFNVVAHPENTTIRVSLLEGSIAVESKEHLLLSMLLPQQSMEVDINNLGYNISEEDTELTSLWSQNKCRVENATAGEMFKRMGYWYGMKIHLENNNNDYRYGFTIKNESFREFLELINELTPLEYNIDGEEVYVRYK